MFGIGEGKLELSLPKENFKVGEKITGEVKLTLNSEKEAKGVKLKFSMQQPILTHNRRDADVGMDIQTVFEKEILLAPGGKFSGTSTYLIEFDTAEISGFVETNALLNMEVFLDIPLSLGFRKSKALVISR